MDSVAEYKQTGEVFQRAKDNGKKFVSTGQLSI